MTEPIDLPRIERAVREILIAIGEDPDRDGLAETPAQAYLSANRTCEMGLRQATGHPYESFVFLLEELTR